jgi:DNA-binding transcriptional regulator YiaG
MALAFRNLTVTPDDPVALWPTEAIATALERGGLEHWRRIAVEVRRDPWGPVARALEEVLGYCRPYGVAELMETALARARERAEAGEREVVAEEVRQAIARSGLSRVEFASRIGTSTTRLSTYTTGKVTPSAALMVRMRRLLERAERRADNAPSACGGGTAAVE